MKFLHTIPIYLLICTLWYINETSSAAKICQILTLCFLSSLLFFLFISMCILFLNHTLCWIVKRNVTNLHSRKRRFFNRRWPVGTAMCELIWKTRPVYLNRQAPSRDNKEYRRRKEQIDTLIGYACVVSEVGDARTWNHCPRVWNSVLGSDVVFVCTYASLWSEMTLDYNL